MKKMNSRSEFEAYREMCKKTVIPQQKTIYVCCGTACLTEGAAKIYESLKRRLEELGIPCHVEYRMHLEDESSVGFVKTGCNGLCSFGPMVRIDPEGWLYVKVRETDVDEIIQKSIVEGNYIRRLGFEDNGMNVKQQQNISFFKNQTRRVLKNCGEINADRIESAIVADDYAALVKALFDMDQDQILQVIKDSGLRGRGGVGIRSAAKWRLAADRKEPGKVLLVNDGVSEVGCFLSRGIVEGDPHKLIEGMVIVGLACGIEEGYLYLHTQYQMAEQRMRNAIRQAEELGLLGDNILGSGKNFHLHLNAGLHDLSQSERFRLSAKSTQTADKQWYTREYISANGELMPATVSDNVETVVNVPDIILNGAGWFRECGTEESPGTKVFVVMGAVNNCGMIEVPFGITVREIIEEICGGMLSEADFTATRLSGSSLLVLDDMDFALTYETMESKGDRIGTGGIEIMAGKVSIMETIFSLLRICVRGSCGKCAPCRESMPRIQELLKILGKGDGTRDDYEELVNLTTLVQTSALCFETCTGFIYYTIEKSECIGCTKCAQVCYMDAIRSSPRQPHEIDTTRCIKCGKCYKVCPKHAIKEIDLWKKNA